MIKLNAFESKILTVMLKKNRWINTTEIAKFSKMSWNTAQKYLMAFSKKKWIGLRNVGNRKYWRARK